MSPHSLGLKSWPIHNKLLTLMPAVHTMCATRAACLMGPLFRDQSGIKYAVLLSGQNTWATAKGARSSRGETDSKGGVGLFSCGSALLCQAELRAGRHTRNLCCVSN